MEAQRAVAEKRRAIEREELEAKVEQEQKRKELVALASQNSRTRADDKAYAIGVVMAELSKVDVDRLNSIAATGMAPDQLIAKAFQGLAERADKIGELNISPDLLRQIMDTP